MAEEVLQLDSNELQFLRNLRDEEILEKMEFVSHPRPTAPEMLELNLADPKFLPQINADQPQSSA